MYVPFHVAEGQLEAAIKGAYGLNVCGMNVTVPYKNAVIPFLTEVDYTYYFPVWHTSTFE